MRIGILGTGPVGVSLAKGFIALGHDVTMGTRNPASETSKTLEKEVASVKVKSFADTADYGEIVVIAINAKGVKETINSANADGALHTKVIIDTTNDMKPERGILIYGGGEVSYAEQIQKLLPDSHVVKAFNTVGAASMYKPDFQGVVPTMFIAGDSQRAKSTVSEIVQQFGWEVLDCGPLLGARALEAMIPIWVNNAMATKSPHHAFKML